MPATTIRRWTKGLVKINVRPTAKMIPGLVCGGLGIATMKASIEHGLPAYSITHLASGNSFGVYFDTLRAAKRAAEQIMDRIPEVVASECDNTGAYPFETQSEIRRFVHSLPRR